jgi:hypothetical protein
MATPNRIAIRIVTLSVRGKPAKTTSDNGKRVKLLQTALSALADRRDWLPIDAVVLPAGYFRVAGDAGTRSQAARLRRLRAEPAIQAAIECCATLAARSPGALLIFGADSCYSPKKGRYDQWAIVCDGTSLVAVARKVFPTEGDIARGFVPSTADYSAPGRVIALASGKRALLCVCYDLFGVTETPGKPSARTQMISRMIAQGREIDRRQQGFLETRRASVAVWQRLMRTGNLRSPSRWCTGFDGRVSMAIGSAMLSRRHPQRWGALPSLRRILSGCRTTAKRRWPPSQCRRPTYRTAITVGRGGIFLRTSGP